MSKTRRGLSFVLCLVMVFSLFAGMPFEVLDFGTEANAASEGRNNDGWLATWHDPIVNLDAQRINDSAYWTAINSATIFNSTGTFRANVKISTGGKDFRIKLTNYYGTTDINVSNMSIGLQGSGAISSMDKNSVVKINGFTIPKGGEYTVEFSMPKTIAAGSSLIVNTCISNFRNVMDAALHGGACWALSGDATETEKLTGIENYKKLTSEDANVGDYNIIPLISEIDVKTDDAEAYTTVVIGDSTVTNDIPNILYNKLIANGVRNVSVVSSGIKGNELLRDCVGGDAPLEGAALESRFDLDALDLPGVKKVFVKIGINDLLHPNCSNLGRYYPKSGPNVGSIYTPTAQQIINGYKRLVMRAHDKGIEIYFLEMTPWYGYTRPDANGKGTIEFNTDTQWLEYIRVQIADWMKANCCEKKQGVTVDPMTTYNTDAISKFPSNDHTGIEAGSTGSFGYVDLSRVNDELGISELLTGSGLYGYKLKDNCTTDGIHYKTLGQQNVVKMIPISIFKNVVISEGDGETTVKNIFTAQQSVTSGTYYLIASGAGSSNNNNQTTDILLCQAPTNNTGDTGDPNANVLTGGFYGAIYDIPQSGLSLVNEKIQRGKGMSAPYIAINPSNLSVGTDSVSGSDEYKAATWLYTSDGSTGNYWQEQLHNRYLAWYYPTGEVSGGKYDTGVRMDKPKAKPGVGIGTKPTSEWYTFNNALRNDNYSTDLFELGLYYGAVTANRDNKCLAYGGPFYNKKANIGQNFGGYVTDGEKNPKPYGGVALLTKGDVTTKMHFTGDGLNNDFVFYNGAAETKAPVTFILSDTLPTGVKAAEPGTTVHVDGKAENDFRSENFKFESYTYGTNRKITVESDAPGVAYFDSDNYVVKLGGDYGTATMTWTFSWQELDGAAGNGAAGTTYTMTAVTRVTNVKYDCDIEVTSGTNKFPDEYSFETDSTADSINVTAVANSVIPLDYMLPETAVWSWSSDNDDAVSVTGNGANATINRGSVEGYATITAVCTDSASNIELCRSSITVMNLTNDIDITYDGSVVDDVNLALADNNNTIGLGSITKNELHTGAEYAWVSSNSKIATVSGNGANATVNALASGNVTITVLCTYQLENGAEISLRDSIVVHISALKGNSIIVDFGLPFQTDMADGYLATGQSLAGVGAEMPNGVTLNSNGASAMVEENTFGDSADTKYGNAASEGSVITYTPTKIAQGKDTIYYSAKNVESNYQYSKLDIIPASSVYYEDTEDFVTYSEDAKTGDSHWEVAQDEVQSANDAVKDQVYGYDSRYGSYTTYSNSSSHYVTVSPSFGANGSGVYPAATFEFTGKGFAVYSTSDDDAGYVGVEVKKVDEATGDKTTVYNKFLNAYATGDYNQTPTIQVFLDEYGKYEVKISVVYDKVFDRTGDERYTYYLDAIRIYNPLDNNDDAKNAYAEVGEANAEFTTIRSKLISADSFGQLTEETTGAVFIDGSTVAATVADYKNNGPKNEVYLANGQGVAFKVEGLDMLDKVELGIKLAGKPSDSENDEVTINGDKIAITSATDMYYNIKEAAVKNDGKVVVANTGDGLISLTVLKTTSKDNAAQLITVYPALGDFAVAQMMSYVMPTEPDPTIEPTVEPTVEPTEEPQPSEDPEPTTDPEPTADPQPSEDPQPDDDQDQGSVINKIVKKIGDFFKKLFGGWKR